MKKTESQYYANEISDEELDALADHGSAYFDEVFFMLSDEEIREISVAGQMALDQALREHRDEQE